MEVVACRLQSPTQQMRALVVAQQVFVNALQASSRAAFGGSLLEQGSRC
jgi:hypothetical protein